jgi:hypothetical protein
MLNHSIPHWTLGKRYITFIVIFISSICFKSAVASDTLFMKTGQKIPVTTCEYKSMNKLYFESDQVLYFVKREEISHLMHLYQTDFDSTWKKLSLDEIKEKRSVTESPYIIGKKGALLQQNGILLTLVMPSLFSGTGIITGANELFYISGGSFIIGVAKWFRGIRKEKISFDLYNTLHYNEKK